MIVVFPQGSESSWRRELIFVMILWIFFLLAIASKRLNTRDICILAALLFPQSPWRTKLRVCLKKKKKCSDIGTLIEYTTQHKNGSLTLKSCCPWNTSGNNLLTLSLLLINSKHNKKIPFERKLSQIVSCFAWSSVVPLLCGGWETSCQRFLTPCLGNTFFV